MIGKRFKLTTKEVSYVSSRKTRIFSGWLICYFHPQYPNKKYFQIWIQISKKFHKSAVKRNDLKRIFFDAIHEKIPQNVTNYYKLFVIVWNKDYDKLNELIVLPKKERTTKIKEYFIYHINSFLQWISKK